MEETGKPDRATFKLMMRLRPFGDFDNLTPDEAYTYIFEASDPAKSPISFNEDVDPESIEAVDFYRNVVDLLNLLKAEQPLKLTQQGNLPVFFCKKLVGMGAAGPDTRWLKEHGMRGEMDCHHIHLINILCRTAGLTRKVHGKISLTKQGEGYLSGKKSLDLYKLLFFKYARRFNWGYEDGYPEAGAVQAGFAFSIYLVSRYGEEPAGAEFYADKFAAAFPFIMGAFPGSAFWTPPQQFLRCYSLRTFERFLCRFGLVEVRTEGAGTDRPTLIAKSDLFGKLIRFRQGAARKGARAESAGCGKRFKHVYQFKITLRETRPSVWRRIQVPETYTFWDLHVAIQDAMGWFDGHLHQFVMRDPARGGEVFIGIPDEDFPSMIPTLAGWRHRISDWFSAERSSARYDYDFGDGWEHDVRLEGILPRDEAAEYPVCVDGEMACPPEDVGGTGGYEDFLKILADPSSDEYESMLEWVGGEFDPADFDPSEVEFDDPEERLKMLRNPW